MIDMTREERVAERARREKIVEGILGFAAREDRPLTQHEEEAVKHERDVIASISLGLENEGVA